MSHTFTEAFLPLSRGSPPAENSIRFSTFLCHVRFIVFLATLLCCPFCSSAQHGRLNPYLPDSGLVAWYPLDGNALDASGNGNHGRVTGLAPTANRAGSKASALLFTGQSDVILLPPSSDFDFSTSRALSVSIWVHLPSAGDGASFDVGGGGGGGAICRNFSAQLRVDVAEVSTTVSASECLIVVKGLLPAASSSWHHIAMAVDDTALSLFIDGALVGRRAIYDMKWETPGIIAWRLDGGSNAHSPRGVAVDDLRLYRRVLTPAEAKLLFLSSPM